MKIADRPRLAGVRVVFLGKLGGLNRREAMRVVRDAGGVPQEGSPETAQLVVLGAEESPLSEVSLISDEVREAASQGLLEVITETEFWQRLGLVDAESAVRKLYTPAMLADLLHVSVRVIRRWHRRGLIVPVRTVHQLPYFDFQEVATARRLAELLASGASPQAIERKLAHLATVVPGVDRPLAQLSVILEGRRLLMRQGEGLIDAVGQRWIDFEALDDDPDRIHESPAVVSLPLARGKGIGSDDPFPTTDELQDHAYDLEDHGDLAGAIDCYHAMLARDGARADLCFQLGELLYRMGEVTAARERYFMAIELNETFVEARASLGAVLAEQGRGELAIAAYRGVLDLHDEYPDVHYNLARLLDEQGDSEHAEPHWQRFLQLAPGSAWADEARQRLGIAPLEEEESGPE